MILNRMRKTVVPDKKCEMRKIICSPLRNIAVFAVTLSVLWLLLFLSALIPNSAIEKNYKSSVYYYSDKDAFEFTDGRRLCSVQDNYADSIWLNVSWNMGKGNALTSSILTGYYDGENYGENAGLYYTVIEGASPNTDYTRYWHGTAMFIRLLHLFTDVEGVKNIGFCAFAVLAIFAFFLLWKRKHTDIAVILALSLALVQVWNIRLSIEYQPAFILAFLLVPLFLVLERKGDGYLTLLCTISGTAVAFFDFLTTESVTLLLPLALVVAVRGKEKRSGNPKQNLLLLLECGLCWGFAYIGAFLVKWLAAGFAGDVNAFSLALESAGVHTLGGSVQGIEVHNRPDNFLSGIFANLTVLFGGVLRVEYIRVFAGIAISFGILFSVWYVFRSKDKAKYPSIEMFALGLVVFVRFLVLNNHSFVHEFFVYRALVTPVFALLVTLWFNVSFSGKKRSKK